MSAPLVESEGRKYPCPLHRYVKTTARLNAAGNYYIVTCPICGVCAKVPV